MHNNKLIKKYHSTPRYWGGGTFDTTGGTTVSYGDGSAAAAEQSSVNSQAGISTIDPLTGQPKKNTAQFMNAAIGGSLTGLLSGLSTYNGIQNNKSLNANQKNIMTGDSVVNSLSSVGSAFGPIGTAAGAGLGIINTLGGALMGTPKVLKDFKANTDVTASGGYGGVAANAASTLASSQTYEKAGLFGKLFGGKKNLVSQANQSNSMQDMANTQVKLNNQAFASQAGSVDMLASQNNNKLYGGNMWTNGSVQYGKEGTKLATKQDGGNMTTNRAGSRPTNTYEEYMKLAGAAARINFKKIRFPSKPQPPLKEEGVMKSNLVKHEEGGTIKPMSVIVDGKLHAHKHELKDIDELSDAPITLKGIPVVSQSEGGEITQHAEVERDELILHYDCTKKLEALYDIGDEESMVIAGKLLAKELIHNTKDSESRILENA